MEIKARNVDDISVNKKPIGKTEINAALSDIEGQRRLRGGHFP